MYKTGKRGRQVWYGRFREPVFENGQWKRVLRNIRLGTATELVRDVSSAVPSDKFTTPGLISVAFVAQATAYALFSSGKVRA